MTANIALRSYTALDHYKHNLTSITFEIDSIPAGTTPEEINKMVDAEIVAFKLKHSAVNVPELPERDGWIYSPTHRLETRTTADF